MGRLQLDPVQHHQRMIRQQDPALQYAAGQTDLKQWQRKLRQRVARLSGFQDMPHGDREPLRVRCLWSREHELGRIEKIVFNVEKHYQATAFLCLPHQRAADKPMPWMICLQGHSSGAHNSVGVDLHDHEQSIVVEGDRDFGLSCMRNGVAALCLEQRGFGERRHNQEQKVDCYLASMQALALGRSMVAERVYDVDRAIDYLCTRKDVDRKRIGVMGNSGGGTTALFAAALLKRVQFAMPSCYFCTFEQSILAMHHCLCNYVPALQNDAEMADVLGTFAPKPLVIVAGNEDPIFPMKGVRSAFRALKSIYRDADAADQVKLVIGQGGHRFYADAAWKAARRIFDWS